MCGIFGIVRFGTPLHDDPQRLFDAIRHRGPDDNGTYRDENDAIAVLLGSVRLSIIDLSPAGHMPMPNEDGTVWLAYNGELYNHLDLRQPLLERGHVYRSRSDTETIIHAYEEYGLAALNRFNGMFAFALYDQARRRVVLARDPMGIKPLYYTWDGQTCLFASELKTLLVHPDVNAALDPQALELYFSLGYPPPAPHTMMRGIYKLEPGAFAILEQGSLHTERYWEPRYSPRTPAWTQPELLAQTRTLVSDAVQRQLMSDVPVGVFLSGGVDSTLVTALAQRFHTQAMDTFSIGFGDESGVMHQDDVTNFDFFHARTVAQQLGTRHHEVVVSGAARIQDLIVDSLHFMEEPSWETSFTSLHLMSQLARQQGVIVVLTGDGGDELFAGYPWYGGIDRSERVAQIPFIRPALSVLGALGGERTAAIKARDLLSKMGRDDHAKYRLTFDVIPQPQRDSLFTPALRAEMGSDPVAPIINTIFARSNDVLAGKVSLVDLSLWVREHFNLRVDRMTMMNSIEGRVPLQDLNVVNFALSIPIHAKMPGYQSKFLLRQAFADIIPEAVLKRKKRPFSTPHIGWLRTALRPLINDMLAPDRIRQQGIFNPATVRTIIDGFDNTTIEHYAYRLWGLLIFQLWHEVYLGKREIARADLGRVAS
jgi:asparagine synthase (glutamine-hydrolysing)